MDTLDQAQLQLRAKIIVGGSRAGWISWDTLVSEASAEHTAVDTRYDDMMQVTRVSSYTGCPQSW